MAEPTFNSEDLLSKATFKVGDDIYKLEFKKEVDNDNTEALEINSWGITVEKNTSKKVHLISSNLPWSAENSVEIRVAGLERVEAEPFIESFRIILSAFLDDDDDLTIHNWLFDVDEILTDLCNHWDEVSLPDAWLNEE